MALVLIIDDEPGMRRTMRRFLKDAGHTVLEAPSGSIGLRLFEEAAPDLVILDLFMPEKEGIQTMREMREVRPDAKIIAISGGGRYGLNLLDGLEQLGATDTLAKPFRKDTFLSSVERALESAAK
jgi:two-component system, chemotaxis family, chemotaxis protein CheY